MQSLSRDDIERLCLALAMMAEGNGDFVPQIRTIFNNSYMKDLGAI